MIDILNRRLITEKFDYKKQLRFWSDILIIIQDIYDIPPKTSRKEINAKIERNLQLVDYITKKHKFNKVYQGMITTGMQAALHHAGYKKKFILK